MAKKQNAESYFVDFDRAIEIFEENHPGQTISRTEIAEKIGKGYQTIVNYQNGRTPSAFADISKILAVIGTEDKPADFNEIVKPKKQ